MFSAMFENRSVDYSRRHFVIGKTRYNLPAYGDFEAITRNWGASIMVDISLRKIFLHAHNNASRLTSVPGAHCKIYAALFDPVALEIEFAFIGDGLYLAVPSKAPLLCDRHGNDLEGIYYQGTDRRIANRLLPANMINWDLGK